MRPNLAQDAPPTSITIGGRDYDCNVDFLVWIDVLRLLRGIETPLETPQQLGAALGTLLAAEQLVFNRPLCGEDPAEVLEAMAEFARLSLRTGAVGRRCGCVQLRLRPERDPHRHPQPERHRFILPSKDALSLVGVPAGIPNVIRRSLHSESDAGAQLPRFGQGSDAAQAHVRAAPGVFRCRARGDRRLRGAFYRRFR